ncbi:DEAD/DEAH box helicase [Georgenia faecalis]|uniref:DEAD/DEAH box helicase n=1 Tax=Georgenia faecalis TaxID=2483799 RepID=UPI000FD77897|nr:DEAD/DEAH box helicase [Georgenia faecalis]
MSELDALLRDRSTTFAPAPDEGWVVLTADAADRQLPVAHLVEALLRVGSDGGSPSVRAAARSARVAVEAVADRRVRVDRRTGRWQTAARRAAGDAEAHDGEPDDGAQGGPAVDRFVDAFVRGAPRALGAEGPRATVAVGVEAGMARAWVEGRSERRVLDVLRAAAEHWAVLGRLAEGERVVALSDEDLRALAAGPTAPALERAGVALRWEPGLVAPARVGHLDDDGTLTWRLRLPDGALSDAEVDALASSHRPLVRLRGSWVLRDAAADVTERPGPRHLAAGERARVAVTGAVVAGGAEVSVADSPALAALRDRLRRRPDAAPPAGLRAPLRAYQRDGLGWLLRNAELGLGSLLADDMGLGKTVSALALHLALRERGERAPTLVVGPASMLTSWEREVARFAPSEAVTRFHGAGRAVDGSADVVLTTYALLRTDRDLLAAHRWGLVVADEAQMAKNSASATARALRGLDARHRLALSGTPVQNSLDDLWSLLDWVAPGLLGPRTRFRQRFAAPVAAGDEAAREQLAALVSTVMLRRTKADPAVAPELPAKTTTETVVSLTPEQVGLYQALTDEALERIADADGVDRKGRILALLTALKQVCNHPAQYLREPAPLLPGRSGKFDALTELLDILGPGAPVLLFSQYVTMGALLTRHLTTTGTGAAHLHGGLGLAERQGLVDRFQAGHLPALVLSLHAAGTGLTLTRAEHVIHYDQWWNPAVEDQATDRAHRIGQSHPVQVHRLTSEGTVEERVGALLASKRALARSALDADVGGQLSELDDAALAGLVRIGGRRG